MSDNTAEKEQQAQNETAENATEQQENKTTEDALGEQINADSSVSGMQHLNDEVTDGDEEDALKKELEEMKDKYVRLVAEFDNYKKRTAKERMELTAVAGKDTIIPLLEVLDDSDRAMKQMEETDDATVIKEGVLLVLNKLQNKLQQRGLKKMEVLNKEFDADYHEAITEIPAPSEDLQGKVLDVIEEGYYLNDKLIRFAKVVVGK